MRFGRTPELSNIANHRPRRFLPRPSAPDNTTIGEFCARPAMALRLAVVRARWQAIQYCPKQDEAMQLAAVGQNGLALRFCKGPSRTVLDAAVSQDSGALEFCPYQDEDLQLLAVTQCGRAVGLCERPSRRVQLAAVENDPLAIARIDDIAEGVQEASARMLVERMPPLPPDPLPAEEPPRGPA